MSGETVFLLIHLLGVFLLLFVVPNLFMKAGVLWGQGKTKEDGMKAGGVVHRAYFLLIIGWALSTIH